MHPTVAAASALKEKEGQGRQMKAADCKLRSMQQEAEDKERISVFSASQSYLCNVVGALCFEYKVQADVSPFFKRKGKTAGRGPQTAPRTTAAACTGQLCSSKKVFLASWQYFQQKVDEKNRKKQSKRVLFFYG